MKIESFDRAASRTLTRRAPISRSIPSLLLRLLFSLGILAFNVTPVSTHELLIFHHQQRVRLPLFPIDGRTYLPVIEVLQILDLAYSESVSAGYLRIFSRNDVVELRRDEPLVRMNQSSVRLAAPVLFHEGRWLAPQGLIPDVLNRMVEPDIKISRSGKRWLIGDRDFIRIDLTAHKTDEITRIIVYLVNAGDIEVRKEGRRVVFSLSNAAVELPDPELSYRDERIERVSLEETVESGQLVVTLADESLQSRITRMDSQEAYLLDVYRRESSDLEVSPYRERRPSLPRQPESFRWRRITIDPGHGGADRGAFIQEGVYEKDVTLSIARKVRWVLETKLGVETVLSRDQDQTVSLEDRALAANRSHSDLFLSIHLGNWNTSATSKSYVYLAKMPPGEYLPEDRGEEGSFVLLSWDQAQAPVLHRSFRLAETLQSVTNQRLNGGEDLGFRHAPLRLLSSLSMPAVLLELGNVSQVDFKEAVFTDPFQNRVAAAVLSALEQFRTVDESVLTREGTP